MEYITTKEAAAKWGISTIRITVLANEGRIPGAQRLGKSWLIPANAAKPPARKANHSGSAGKAPVNENEFSLPLYHFRPDWCYLKEDHLSERQQKLIEAETAVLECRFEDAYPILESILQAPEDIATEIGALWAAGMCCIYLNKPDCFSKIYLRLQLLLAEDFPHRDDLKLILDYLETFLKTVGDAAKYDSYHFAIHEQSLPLLSVLSGYAHLTGETMHPDTADTTLMELNLHLLENTGVVIVIEMMHLYLLGIYGLRQNKDAIERHARLAVEIAYENKYFLPFATFYHYYASILAPFLAEYPEEFQLHLQKMSAQCEANYSAFLSSLRKHSVLSKLTDEEQPYVYAVLLYLPNAEIAERLGVSLRTVNRKLELLCEKFGVSSKKDLKDFLNNNL